MLVELELDVQAVLDAHLHLDPLRGGLVRRLLGVHLSRATPLSETPIEGQAQRMAYHHIVLHSEVLLLHDGVVAARDGHPDEVTEAHVHPTVAHRSATSIREQRP